MKIKSGFKINKNNGSIWCDMWYVSGVASQNNDLEELQDKAKIYYNEGKCFCKSCHEVLEQKIISGSPHTKLCECLKKFALED